jgi:hypothetical protein
MAAENAGFGRRAMFEELVGEEDPEERTSNPLCVRSWEDTRQPRR